MKLENMNNAYANKKCTNNIHINNRYTIEVGDRIAQLVIMPVILCDFIDSWNDTERGTGGFGSTGK